MTQRELEQQVAALIGEDVSLIRNRGFSFFDPFNDDLSEHYDDLPPHIIDWDLGSPRMIAWREELVVDVDAA